MRALNEFLFFLLIFMFLFFIQEVGFFVFSGVHVNLILSFLIFIVVIKRRIWAVLPLIFFFLLFILWGRPFWLLEAGVFSIAVLITFLIIKILTGRTFLDFTILIIFSTIFVFYAIPISKYMLEYGFDFSNFLFPNISTLSLELLLNFIAGMVFIFLGSRRIFSRVFER